MCRKRNRHFLFTEVKFNHNLGYLQFCDKDLAMKNSISALNDIILHAYNETDYYRQLFDEREICANGIKTKEDLASIPFLTRDELQEKESIFLAKQYHKFPYKAKLQLRRAITTSGHIMKIYWDEDDDISSATNLSKLRNEWYKINEGMNFCAFHSSRYIGNRLTYHKEKVASQNGNFLSYSIFGLTEERIKDCFEYMSEIGTAWLSLRPSIAILLAEAIKKNNLPLPPTLRYIELSGEVMQEDQREFIREVFRTDVAYLYRSDEIGSAAYECRHNSLHILENNVEIEVIGNNQPIENEIGELCVTTILNHAMPLIRLRTGDTGKILYDSCPCGSKAPTLRLINGYPCEFYLTKSNQKISGTVLAFLVEQTNEFMSGAIRKFHFTQNEPGSFTVDLMLKQAYENWQKAIIETFLSNITEPGLKDAKWNFNFL